MSLALQRTIHVACRELRIDNDARHALQLEVCGKTSMTDMSEADLKKLLDRLKKDGFKQVSKGGLKHKPAPRADLRYVHVLWRLLGDAGKLKQPGRAGLNTFVRARFEDTWNSVPIDIDALTDTQQISDVTQALKSWCAREGIPTGRSSSK